MDNAKENFWSVLFAPLFQMGGDLNAYRNQPKTFQMGQRVNSHFDIFKKNMTLYLKNFL